MKSISGVLLGLLSLSSAAWTSRAHGASPSLQRVLPPGVQRGTEAAIVLEGARLGDAVDVFFYGSGVTLSNLEAAGENQVKAALKVAPDCPLGEHALRVRTRTGISELRTFYVGALPQVDEVEPNSDFRSPQKVPLDVTVTGVVESEGVDFFAFEAKKGQRVTAEVEGLRLGRGLFDPHVAILDSARFELAACDDAVLLRQDPVASAIVPEDGVYVVQVRESSYGGGDHCVYRLHLGTFPRPLAALPAGGKPGEEVEISLLGDVAGELRQKVALPLAAEPGFGIFAQDAFGISPSPLPLRLCEGGNVLEAEPNGSLDQATPAAAPAALCGVISAKGDVDFFRFAAKKGQVLDIHVCARRIRSPLDPVLTVYAVGGGSLQSNDDAVGPDSYLRFSVPEDKEYALSVADHLGEGGPCHAYRVEVSPVEPRLILSVPQVAQFSQERQSVVVPRGNRYATLIRASRVDFGGDLVLAFEGLPQGVGFQCETMPGSIDAIPVVFEAAADAPLGGAFARVMGRHADPAVNVPSSFRQSAELIVGPPGQSVYWTYESDRLAAAVAEEAPFKLSIVEPRVPLVQTGSMNLKVVAERKQGFTAPIGIQMVFQPSGVSSAGGVSIPEGQSEASIPLNANAGATARDWKIAVLGTADPGTGPVHVASQLATLRVAPPFITLKLDKGSAEQGKETQILAQVSQNVPFDGKAKVTLLGLPPKVVAPDVEIDKEAKELVFKVSADPQSPPGVHRNIFCRVVVTQDGEPIVHAAGSTELRIDVPLPPKPSEPAQPVAAAPQEKPKDKPEEPKPPPSRPLSRLEKLRLEAAGRSAPAKEEEKK